MISIDLLGFGNLLQIFPKKLYITSVHVEYGYPAIDPPGPANRWSLFSHMVSVHPSQTQKRYNAYVEGGPENKIRALVDTMCENNDIYWLWPGGSL